MAAPEASVHPVRNRLCYHFSLYQTNESCSESVSRKLRLLIIFNKFCVRVTAPNVTEAERPFYECSAVISTRNTKTTALAVSFSAILSCEILDFGQHLSVCES